MPEPRDVALEHYAKRRRLVEAAAQVAAQAWGQVDPDDILRSWLEQLQALTTVVSGAQLAAAQPADDYATRVLQAQDLDAAADGQVAARTFAGAASDGRSLATLLANPAIVTLSAVQDGVDVARALVAGHANLNMIVRTQVADAGRAADQVAMVARRSVTGYVRVAVGDSCNRCMILAGQTYRWSAGFNRHPRCDCIHLPTEIANAGGLVQDPDEIYARMSPAERTRAGFTAADQQAIEDGADLNAVVNAHRGMYTTVVGGRTIRATREGTTTRGTFGGFEIDPETGAMRRRGSAELENRRSGSRRIQAARAPRLTPEQIYRIVGDDRDEAVRLLRRNGYLFGRTEPARAVPRPAAPGAVADLASLTVPQLRALAAARGITGLSRARKADIIAALGGSAKVAGLDAMTVVQLRAEARRLGVKIPSGSRKADMVELLRGKTTAKDTAKKAATAAKKLEDLTVAQLRALAKERGLSIPSGLRKTDVVSYLRSWETGHGRSALTGEKLVRPPAPAKPPAPVQTGPVFTSARDAWWNDLTEDTGLDRPRPVRDVRVVGGSGGDYLVTGSVWRVNGRAFLIEHVAGPALEKELRAGREVVEQLLQFVDELPDSRASIQRAFVWARGANPADDYWAQTYNLPGFRSLAVAGRGKTIVWGQAFASRPRQIFGSLKHEFGHNVDDYARSLGIDSKSSSWSTAARDDAATAAKVTDFRPNDEMAAGHPIALMPDPAKGYPFGVSTYGKSSPAEDWAESTWMYLLGQIGTGRLVPGGSVVPLYFRDIFPARARVLDRIFPDVAAAQRRR